MSEPIFSPTYWAKRLRNAPNRNPHHTFFMCSDVRWAAIEAQHRRVLSQYVGRTTSILDMGCGWGRLLDLLPRRWRGEYLGIDLCPELIAEARSRYEGSRRIRFDTSDLRDTLRLRGLVGPDKMDLAVLVSVRGMVLREKGPEAWTGMLPNVWRSCRRVLYLEYDPDGWGELE